MDKIWYRNLSKSEVIARCDGDENPEWPRRTDKKPNVKKNVQMYMHNLDKNDHFVSKMRVMTVLFVGGHIDVKFNCSVLDETHTI